jgi:hypothetical protein
VLDAVHTTIDARHENESAISKKQIDAPPPLRRWSNKVMLSPMEIGLPSPCSP